jgi:hypothetical protein
VYEDRSIAWMMSGGNRFESSHQRLDRIHERVLHDSAPTQRVPGLRPLLTRAMSAVGLGSGSASTSTSLDCCVA